MSEGNAPVAMFGSLMVLATFAVILSQRANTAKVLLALGDSTAGVINAAVSPITGGKASPIPTMSQGGYGPDLPGQ